MFPSLTQGSAEVSKHASSYSCWVIIRGNVYDLTAFLDAHPGGSAVILKHAGKDATEAFEPIHASDTIAKYLNSSQILGPVSESDFVEQKDSIRALRGKQLAIGSKKWFKLSAVVGLKDFERAATYNLSPQALAFIQAGADDEVAKQWNRQSWQAVRFRPRVLRPIRHIDLSTSILGTRFSMPFFICPAGGGKLAHPKGEVLMTKAASQCDVLHWVCNMAGCTQLEMAEARSPDQTLYWQIYAKTDLSISEDEIRHAIVRGYRGFALTVDAIQAGNRERDIRHGLEELEDRLSDDIDLMDYRDDTSLVDGGISAIRPPVYSTFDWHDAIKWLRGLTDLPIAIKGIQCWEDAQLCMQYGVHPWLSNHGGRQLDGAPSALETLIEIRHHYPSVLRNCDVIVDGGFCRGADIVKALALGAKGVGVGRPFLYALSFGQAGVKKAIMILQKEVQTAMALLGVESIAQLDSNYVDTSALVYSRSLRARL